MSPLFLVPSSYLDESRTVNPLRSNGEYTHNWKFDLFMVLHNWKFDLFMVLDL